MRKEEFVIELSQRVRLNVLYILSHYDFESDKEESFDEWMHFLTDNGIESLFEEA